MDTTNFKASTWQALIKFDKEHGFFKTKQAVLVGLSGGADSVALLHFVKQMSTKKHFDVYACHIHHGLRKSAGKDAAFSSSVAKKLNIPFIIKKVKTPALAKEEKLSIEHAARKARYAALGAVAKKFNCKKIALAHHADDNAETILLNILRGTKAKGLLGIPVKRPLGKIEIIRPFLVISRSEVLAYIKAHKLSFITDETNLDDAYTRNWVRHILLPLLETKQPKITAHLLAMASDLAKYIKRD
ncbi:MAG: tRNA lysidine(34) synthetase TilS [Elusimicrobiota bacterium]|jgi:tRNA(Ile)-lysidine synthase|nr:tRNA lysidine(34) synthetase TilS [Elusimicrobiota bacterium]